MQPILIPVFPVPPTSEQISIIEKLTEETNRINLLKERFALLIGELENVRSTLIAHAVTDRIKSPSNPNEQVTIS